MRSPIRRGGSARCGGCSWAMWRSGRSTASLAKGSQDVHFDMGEMVALVARAGVGYAQASAARHRGSCGPGLRSFPLADWAYYLFAMACRGFRAVDRWRLSARFLDAEKRVVGLAAAHLRAVLQFPCAEVQRQHGADPAVGGDDAVVPALVRDAQLLDAALAGLWRRRRDATANTGRSSCSRGSASPRSPTSGARAYFRSAAPWVTIAVGAARDRAACRSGCSRTIFVAVLLCGRHARRAVVHVHRASRAGLSRRQLRLCRGCARDPCHCRAAEPGRDQGHGMAASARSPAGGECILGRAARRRR